jgi:hypothetical protein
MTATPPPAPAAPPRIVTVAFWFSAAGAVLLIAGGALGVLTALTTPPISAAPVPGLSRQLTLGLGALFLIVGLVIGFLSRGTRDRDKRFRRVQVGVSIALSMLAVYVVANGMSANLKFIGVAGVIAAAVGAALLLQRPAAAWFNADEQ